MSQVATTEFWSLVGVLAGIYTVFALGLQLQVGYTGLLNLGHAASMAIAAYAMAIFVTKVGLGLWLAVPLAIGVGGSFGLVVAVPAARLGTGYLAVATLGLAEIVRILAINLEGLTGGWQGTINLLGAGRVASYNTEWLALEAVVHRWIESVVRRPVPRSLAMLFISWAAVIGVLLFMRVLVRSPWGRVLRAIREDETVAAALGKNVVRYKVQSLVLGAAVGAVAGLLFAFHTSFFTPNDFAPLTFFGFTILTLGGIGTLSGPPTGALVLATIYASSRFLSFPPFSYLDAADRGYLRLIIIGLLLIALVALRPGGLLGRRVELTLE